jgi:hypothetical protein
MATDGARWMTKLNRNLAMLVVVTVCASRIVAGSPVNAAEISGYPPMEPQLIFSSASWIYIDGEIDAGTSAALEDYINRNGVTEGSKVRLNSPGGDLYGGMALGRTIRKYRLNTDVGVAPLQGKERYESGPGYCYSACAIAFLGGQFRYLQTDSHYGVHRFYFSGNNNNGADVAQVVSASIVNYLREMEIDIGLFEASTIAGKEEVYEPARSDLEHLNVINNGFTKPVWTVESNDGQLYLKGERQTVNGINKFIVMCSNSKLALYIIFDPQGRQEEVMNFPAHSLVIDGQNAPIKPASAKILNGWFNGIYNLTSSQWEKLEKAENVGVIIRGAYEAPIFLGFDAMPFDEGKKKLAGLVNNCR